MGPWRWGSSSAEMWPLHLIIPSFSRFGFALKVPETFQCWPSPAVPAPQVAAQAVSPRTASARLQSAAMQVPDKFPRLANWHTEILGQLLGKKVRFALT